MKILKITMIFLIIILILVLGILFTYKYMISPVSKTSNEVTIEIPMGSTKVSIGQILFDNKLIKNETIYKIYIKLNKIDNLKAGIYKLNQNMSLESIIKSLERVSNINPDSFMITFPEGKNMRKIALIISDNTNNTEENVFNLLKDEEYINEVINKYWFITDEIKKKDIYYPLEGYLFPNTYMLNNKDVTVEEIFKMMLDEMDKKLTKYKKDIKNLGFTIHQFLTFASIVESEGINQNDRDKISSVFHNRLDKNMPLGSCVTTYYAVKLEMSERDLYKSEINLKNSYNTRGPDMNGILPVGPISNPGEESIKATIYPDEAEYLYFVADKNYVTYFTKTYDEHLSKISELKTKGIWKEW